jgi:hypothetical protein
MDGFEIPLVHCLHSYHRSIPYNMSKFPWLNRSNSEPRVESVEIGLSGLQNRMFRFWQTSASLRILVFLLLQKRYYVFTPLIMPKNVLDHFW